MFGCFEFDVIGKSKQINGMMCRDYIGFKFQKYLYLKIIWEVPEHILHWIRI